jgi:hypothetical protein
MRRCCQLCALRPSMEDSVLLLGGVHAANHSLDIVIQQEAHYPAAASSRDASATSAALKSGYASKIASVP